MKMRLKPIGIVRSPFKRVGDFPRDCGSIVGEIEVFEEYEPRLDGPHTGVDEAIPAGKYMRQFFQHLGFNVKTEWYVGGEHHGHELLSTKGKLGVIRGRPNSQDLAKVEKDRVKLIESLT